MDWRESFARVDLLGACRTRVRRLVTGC